MLASPGRVAAAVAIQVAILALVPAKQVNARLTGRPITLAVAPVDPFDPIRGHYLSLGYEVEREADRQLPSRHDGREEDVWLLLHEAQPAWTLESVVLEKPRPAAGVVAIRARRTYRVEIPNAGLFWVGEASRRAAEAALRAEAQRLRTEHDAELRAGGHDLTLDARRALGPLGLVDMRVDEHGEVALERLRVRDVVVEW
jgi:hypothetical protein